MRLWTKEIWSEPTSNWLCSPPRWSAPLRPWTDTARAPERLWGTFARFDSYQLAGVFVPERCPMVERRSSFPLNKTLLICLALIAFAAPSVCAANDWKYEETRRDAREFVTGGTIHVPLTVGGLHLQPGGSSPIRRGVPGKTRAETGGRETTLRVDGPRQSS